MRSDLLGKVLSDGSVVVGVCDGSLPLDMEWWTDRERQRMQENPPDMSNPQAELERGIFGVVRFEEKNGWRWRYRGVSLETERAMCDAVQLPFRAAEMLPAGGLSKNRGRSKIDEDQREVDFATGKLRRVQPRKTNG